MHVLKLVLQVAILILSLFLTLLILMHKGKGGGFSDAFNNLTGSAESSGVAEKNLNRWTVAIGLVWFLLIVLFGVLTKFSLLG